MPKGRNMWRVGDSPRAKKIIQWLRKSPVPEKLLATDGEGEECTVVVKRGEHPIHWKDVTGAVLHCETLRAIDEHGQILRTLELDPDDPRLTVEDQTRQARAELATPGREPIISVDVPMLVRSIAEAMKDVAKTAAIQQAEAHASGMNAMVQVVNLCLGVMQRIDERLEDREERTEELLAAREMKLLETTAEPSTRDQLLQAAMAKVFQGEGAGTNGASTGVDAAKVAQLTQLFHSFAKQATQQPPEGS